MGNQILLAPNIHILMNVTLALLLGPHTLAIKYTNAMQVSETWV